MNTVGEKIDGCAAELLAKVQEKLPVVRQDPREVYLTHFFP